MKRFSSLLLIVTLLLTISSCQKDRNITSDKLQAMEELTIPDNFNWKTTRDITIQFTASKTGIVELLNLYNVRYQQAFINEMGTYTMKLTLPSYEKKVKVKFGSQETELDITSDILTYTIN